MFVRIAEHGAIKTRRPIGYCSNFNDRRLLIGHHFKRTEVRLALASLRLVSLLAGQMEFAVVIKIIWKCEVERVCNQGHRVDRERWSL